MQCTTNRASSSKLKEFFSQIVMSVTLRTQGVLTTWEHYQQPDVDTPAKDGTQTTLIYPDIR